MLPIIHRKSKYFILFTLLITADLLTLIFKNYVHIPNAIYVILATFLLPCMFKQYWRRPVFFIPIILGAVLLVFLSLGNPAISLYIAFLGWFAISVYVLFDLMTCIVAGLKIPFFTSVLFLYLFSPTLRIYFLLSGTKMSEFYYVLTYFLEILLAFALLFLREDNPKHAYNFRTVTVDSEEKAL